MWHSPKSHATLRSHSRCTAPSSSSSSSPVAAHKFHACNFHFRPSEEATRDNEGAWQGARKTAAPQCQLSMLISSLQFMRVLLPRPPMQCTARGANKLTLITARQRVRKRAQIAHKTQPKRARLINYAFAAICEINTAQGKGW